jgi:hypothetical protein
MTEDKPLHVRVAEALGCSPDEYVPAGSWEGRKAWSCHCLGANKGEAHGDMMSVYRYDLDWSVTGPLIEKYDISLDSPEVDCDDHAAHTCLKWVALPKVSSLKVEGVSEKGPLEAVCFLLLKMAEAGKL